MPSSCLASGRHCERSRIRVAFMKRGATGRRVWVSTGLPRWRSAWASPNRFRATYARCRWPSSTTRSRSTSSLGRKPPDASEPAIETLSTYGQIRTRARTKFSVTGRQRAACSSCEPARRRIAGTAGPRPGGETGPSRGGRRRAAPPAPRTSAAAPPPPQPNPPRPPRGPARRQLAAAGPRLVGWERDRLMAGMREVEAVLHGIGRRVARGQRRQAERVLDEREHRRVIVDGVADVARPGERRRHRAGDPVAVAGRVHAGRGHVVVEAAALGVVEDHRAPGPSRTLGHGAHGEGGETLAPLRRGRRGAGQRGLRDGPGDGGEAGPRGGGPGERPRAGW